MRSIGNLPAEPQARQFSDYLLSRGIGNQTEPDENGTWMIWVMREDQLEEAAGLLEKFRAQPSHPEFAAAMAAAAEVREREARELEEYRRRFFTRNQVFPGSRAYSAGVWTYLLIVACGLVAIYSKFGSNTDVLRPLFISDPESATGGFLPEVRSGEIWRLFSPVLIHFSPAHLLGNMMWLFELGSMIEARRGRAYFLVLTAALALGSDLAQYIVAGPAFGGMSGVVYGLFGFVWVRGRIDPRAGFYISRFNVILMLIWFVICWSGSVGPIANAAHGAGLVLGAAWGALSGWVARKRGI